MMITIILLEKEKYSNDRTCERCEDSKARYRPKNSINKKVGIIKFYVVTKSTFFAIVVFANRTLTLNFEP